MHKPQNVLILLFKLTQNFVKSKPYMNLDGFCCTRQQCAHVKGRRRMKVLTPASGLM